LKTQKEITDIFWENFDRQLKLKSMSQKDFAIKHGMHNSKITKWKNGDQIPDIVEIRKIADHFNINVNDLLYSEKEKIGMDRLKDLSYKPISASQSISIRIFDNYFRNYKYIIVWILFSFAIICGMTYFMTLNNEIAIFISIFSIPVYNYMVMPVFTKKKHYIIDHLDLIYYEMNNSKNNYLSKSVIIKIINVLLSLIIFSLVKNINNSIEIERYILTGLIFMILYFIFAATYGFLELKKEYKKKITDREIAPYKTVLMMLLVNTVLFYFLIILSVVNPSVYIPYLIIVSAMYILSIIDFILISKKYAEYKLMYESYLKPPRELYFK